MAATTIQAAEGEVRGLFRRRRRLPVVLQTEAAECGLACLAMVAAYYGREEGLGRLRQRFSVSSTGLSLKGLVELAARMDLSARALQLDSNDLDYLQCPAVLHWDMKHYVVLKSVSRGKAMIHDPSIGERRLDLSEIARHFSGVALVLTPTPGFKAEKITERLRVKQLLPRVSGLARSLTVIVVLALLLQLFAVVSPLYMQTVVDEVIRQGETHLLSILTIGFGLLLSIQVFTALLRELLVLSLATRLSAGMAAGLFHHLIRLPMDYFSKRHIGDIVSRFGSLNSIQDMITNGIVIAIVDGVLVAITVVVMFVYDVRLTLISIAAVGLYLALRLRTYRPLQLLTQEQLVAKARLDSNFMESVRGIRVLKLFQREQTRQAQWQAYLSDSLKKMVHVSRFRISVNSAKDALFGVDNLVMIYLGTRAVLDDLMTLGMLFAYVSFKGRFVLSMSVLVDRYIDFRMLELHLDRLSDIVSTPAEKVDEPERDPGASAPYLLPSRSLPALAGKIEVRDLGFRYSETSPFVLSGVSFVIRPGEHVAIVGPSGCGKTTLMLCLMGLLSPTEGEILIDDQPLSNLYHYRKRIAGILQDDQLLTGTLAENISCFSPDADQNLVEEAARMACIHDEIMRFPMRYHTLVGDMGSSLSGGQRQRVVLARAFYRQPQILFLDEATSHLDVTSESKVTEQIKGLSTTRVFVAHRPETIASADWQISLARDPLPRPAYRRM